MHRLEPNELLSSATTILDAVDIFGNKPNGSFMSFMSTISSALFSTETYSSHSVALRFSLSR
jgi:hypothetical protein